MNQEVVNSRIEVDLETAKELSSLMLHVEYGSIRQHTSPLELVKEALWKFFPMKETRRTLDLDRCVCVCTAVYVCVWFMPLCMCMCVLVCVLCVSFAADKTCMPSCHYGVGCRIHPRRSAYVSICNECEGSPPLAIATSK